MSQMMQGGPPPGLLQMLQGGAAGQPQPGPPAQPQPDAGESSEREPIAILKQMIELAQRYIAVEPDAEDKATMAKVYQTLHQYLAAEQKDAEAALGGGSATRVLRKHG